MRSSRLLNTKPQDDATPVESDGIDMILRSVGSRW